MKRVIRRQAAVLFCAAALLTGCSEFTSVSRDASGEYVITGWDSFPFRGARGFVWICDYDPQTKTLTVTEKK